MTGWVTGIREVKRVDVPIEDAQQHGPRVLRRELTVIDLPHEAWKRLLHFRVSLPLHRSAGPCGTSLRGACAAGTLRWSIQHLVDPLALYYAAYEPPMRFGAKPGPRGRRVA